MSAMKPIYVFNLITTFIIILLISVIVIMLASGYRFDFQTKTITGTGIITVNSNPDGALVYVNDVAQDATNTSIDNLRPGEYAVRIEKEGYSVWTKTVTVEKELVTRIEARLMPLYPTLQSLTYTGVTNPVIAPDGQRIVFSVSQGLSAGLWLIDLDERPFNLSRNPQLILADTEDKTYSQSQYTWSPTSDTLLIKLVDPQAITSYELLSIQDLAITAISDIDEINAQWKDLEDSRIEEKTSAIDPDQLQEIDELVNQAWSMNNLYILHEKETDTRVDYYIYPIKPSVNQQGSLPTPTTAEAFNHPIVSFNKEEIHTIQWFPDSKHLIIARETGENTGVIELIEIDGTNRTQVFSGTIKDLFVYPNISGSKLVVLTRFNLENNSFNLYSINLN